MWEQTGCSSIKRSPRNPFLPQRCFAWSPASSSRKRVLGSLVWGQSVEDPLYQETHQRERALLTKGSGQSLTVLVALLARPTYQALGRKSMPGAPGHVCKGLKAGVGGHVTRRCMAGVCGDQE